ncbi:hypothetical protein ACFQ3C_16580 [Seohaeicola saemankumensis]|uniref:Uncharacterized protein n=1 Tax=Seohaeicola saemankumensis TaxID=481181 RepID=A0ABW3TH81_9RHOB
MNMAARAEDIVCTGAVLPVATLAACMAAEYAGATTALVDDRFARPLPKPL